MEFENRLELMEHEIGYAGECIRYIHSAKEWKTKILSIEERAMLDFIMQKLFDRDIAFSEDRQSEMELTIRELLINSISACKEKDDLFVDLNIYYGRDGLVMQVIDDGPGFNHREEIRKRRESSKYMNIKRFREMVRTSDEYKGGTGLYCLVHYASDFQFNKRGNEVTARFDL